MPQDQGLSSKTPSGIDIAKTASNINKRIIRLSMANAGLLVLWYLLSAEHRSQLTFDGVADFDVTYKILLLALAALTIGLWVSLARAFWKRLGMSTWTQSSTKDNEL
jgi:hypothetical protein